MNKFEYKVTSYGIRKIKGSNIIWGAKITLSPKYKSIYPYFKPEECWGTTRFDAEINAIKSFDEHRTATFDLRS